MKKYGLLRLPNSTEDDPTIICTWDENIVDRMIDTATNTSGVKTVKDLVTNIRIKPDKSVFYYPDGPMRKPRGLYYNEGPKTITKQEALERLSALKNDTEELQRYVDYLQGKTEERKHSR